MSRKSRKSKGPDVLLEIRKYLKANKIRPLDFRWAFRLRKYWVPCYRAVGVEIQLGEEADVCRGEMVFTTPEGVHVLCVYNSEGRLLLKQEFKLKIASA